MDNEAVEMFVLILREVANLVEVGLRTRRKEQAEKEAAENRRKIEEILKGKFAPLLLVCKSQHERNAVNKARRDLHVADVEKAQAFDPLKYKSDCGFVPSCWETIQNIVVPRLKKKV